LVHQTGLADTTVAEDDDLVSLSALVFLSYLDLRYPNLQQNLLAGRHG
jgi:hypothetical protein